MIGLRLRAGKRRKIQDGGYRGGEVAFGCRPAAGRLVADERETHVLARISELRETGLTLRSMAAQLNLEGLRPRRSMKRTCRRCRREAGLLGDRCSGR
jgi:site-specific DNA recombinase